MTSIRRIWYFIWKDNSVWSWFANIVIAFVLVKFLVYPGLGLLLGTTHPVVAVVSGSMEHDAGFDEWWSKNKDWYVTNGVTKEQFERFSFSNGFNKGDIIMLKGREEIALGDVVVYNGYAANPIIHRVVYADEEAYRTKGDHNTGDDGIAVTEELIIGKAVFKVPYLGWVKIIFAELTGLGGVI